MAFAQPDRCALLHDGAIALGSAVVSSGLLDTAQIVS
jgi:hypothetical protein